ncbi:hypothetical protein ACT3TC_10635 [Halomonas sp. AOP27-A1-41]|uniref:hypothetical protein n=1 Tax=Halomonas sp. AOP27-A1-41 TaxID=3457707 RepID=UPI00403466C9
MQREAVPGLRIGGTSGAAGAAIRGCLAVRSSRRVTARYALCGHLGGLVARGKRSAPADAARSGAEVRWHGPGGLSSLRKMQRVA